MDHKPDAQTIAELAALDEAECAYNDSLTEIVGVVGVRAQGGSVGELYDIWSFSFAAWRHIAGELRCSELYVMRRVSKDGKSEDEFNRFPEGTVHRLRVLLSADETRAVLCEVVAKNLVDEELLEVLRELQQPVIIESALLGPLTLDRRIDRFEGNAAWNGNRISVRLDAEGDLNIEDQLETAKELFENAADWDAKVRAFVIEDKLELANDWRYEDDPPITEEEFLRRMTLNSIVIERDGGFEFWHDDGDLFAGHAIVVRGSLTDGITDSDIPG